MTDNPYYVAAERVLTTQRSWMNTTGTERMQAITELLVALGSTETTPQDGVLPADHGMAALIGLCLLLKRHGDALKLLSEAHQQLHS